MHFISVTYTTIVIYTPPPKKKKKKKKKKVKYLQGPLAQFSEVRKNIETFNMAENVTHVQQSSSEISSSIV